MQQRTHTQAGWTRARDEKLLCKGTVEPLRGVHPDMQRLPRAPPPRPALSASPAASRACQGDDDGVLWVGFVDREVFWLAVGGGSASRHDCESVFRHPGPQRRVREGGSEHPAPVCTVYVRTGAAAPVALAWCSLAAARCRTRPRPRPRPRPRSHSYPTTSSLCLCLLRCRSVPPRFTSPPPPPPAARDARCSSTAVDQTGAEARQGTARR
jgi:hypothetical protein